jgi:hypothetical protein
LPWQLRRQERLQGLLTMAKLTSKQRRALPASTFAGPDRSYPVPDKSHAANAKARATQAVEAGRMSPSTKAKIDAKANKVLHRSGHKP